LSVNAAEDFFKARKDTRCTLLMLTLALERYQLGNYVDWYFVQRTHVAQSNSGVVVGPQWQIS
jgi:hypothetical protein